MIPYLDLRRANDPLTEEIQRAVDGCLRRSSYLRGPETEAFEAEWAAYCGQQYAVACNSGTDALTIAAAALNLDRATIPANTLPLTGIGLSRAGAVVSLSEVGADGWMAEPTPHGVPVLLYGRIPGALSADWVLYDAAHAHGWKPPAGAHAAWSFYPTKSLGALGDAGAVTTNDTDLAAAMRDICGRDDVLRDERQITSRMDEIQAAILRVKLRHLSGWLTQRAEVAGWYQSRLQPLGVTLAGESLHHIYAIRVSNRDHLRDHLQAKGIETKVHWRSSLDEVAGPWDRRGHFPQAHRWANEVLSLPMYPGLTPDEVTHICDAVESYAAVPSENRSVPGGTRCPQAAF